MMYDLDTAEERLVLEHRKDVEYCRLRKEKQSLCTHNFRYAGHSHNDDCYECIKCGETEYR